MAKVITSKKQSFTLINAIVDDRACDVFVDGGVITRVADAGAILPVGEVIDIGGKELYPGLFDIHCHGCLGFDTTDGYADGHMAAMARHWAENGTTSWLATTMTMDKESILKALSANTDIEDGCNIPGFHLEGPYINLKYKGAQNPEYVQKPNLKDLEEYKGAMMITVAPEVEGGIEFIKNCKISVALGHTDATYEQACEAFDAGADNVTHTFNAMPGFHHRNPSVVGAAIEKNAYVQAITDGTHLHKSTVIMLYRTFGVERMIIISDEISAAGLCDGVYESGGLRVTVKDGVARIDSGTIAGSTTTLYNCVLKAIEFGIPKKDAFRMASRTPAELLKLKKGRIEAGYDAEFVVVNPDLSLEMTIILNK